MEKIFMNTEKSKTNEPHQFILNLSQRVDLRSSNKHVVLQNLSIYQTRKKIRKQYKNNKLNSSKWNDEFQLPDSSYSVSDVQDYIEYIIKKHEALTTNRPLHVSINRVNDRLVFKIKDRCKLELQTPETMKLSDDTQTKQKTKKNYQVLKQLKQFQFSVIQQIININKSLKYYTLFLLISLMLIC